MRIRLAFFLALAVPSWAAMPIITSFTASANPVTSGGASTLSWAVTSATTGATACYLQSGIGATVSSVSCTSSTVVNPTSTTTYTLLATGTGGSAADSGNVYNQIVVTVGTGALAATQAASTCTGNVTQWDVCEITISYSGAVTNPFEDVIAQAAITAPTANVNGDTAFSVRGFYAGGVPSTAILGSAAGTGYTVGDVLVLTGGDSSDASVTVTGTSSGVVSTFTLSGGSAGGYYSGQTYRGMGGTGTQATFQVTAVTGNVWKLRFSPQVTGSYTGTLTLSAATDYKTFPISFTSVAGTRHGFARLYGAGAPYQLKREDGTTFLPIGMQQGFSISAVAGSDLSWTLPITGPGGNNTAATNAQWFGTYTHYGFNFTRLMGGQLTYSISGIGNVAGYFVGSFNQSGKNTYWGHAVEMGRRFMLGAHPYDWVIQACPIVDPTSIANFPSGGLANFDVTALSDSIALANAYREMVARYSAYVDILELMNENGHSGGIPPQAFLNTYSGFLKSVDPYKHLVTTSFPPSSAYDQPTGAYSVTNIDLVEGHTYLGESPGGATLPSLTVDQGVSSAISSWRASLTNQPFIWGEAGNQSPWPDNDSTYHERYRIQMWTYWANLAWPVFWNSYGGNSGAALTNIFLGNPQRPYSQIFRSFLSHFDPTSTTISSSLSISAPVGHTGRSYCLGSSTYLGCYVLHATDHTTTVTSATLTVTIPANGMTVYWIDPQTGNTLSTATVSAGSTALAIPQWVSDVAMYAIPTPTMPSNSVTISDTTGSQQASRPVTIPRVFTKGEISNYPMPVGAGVSSVWQADVKNRYRDGSASCTITATTNATPVVVTCGGGHAFIPMDQVTISGTGTGLNGTWYVQSVTATTMTLLNSAAPGATFSSGTVSGPAPGSVKMADISFFATIPAGGSITATFINATNPCSSGDATACANASQSSIADIGSPIWITGTAPAWDGQIKLTGPTGTVLTTNAQTMLSALSLASNQVRYWLQGPVVTQAIIEDRSTALSQDIGFDANKSVHPWFVATEYQGWPGVQVEYIAENTFSDRLQDQTYQIDLLTNYAGGGLAGVYTRPNHLALTCTQASPSVCTTSVAHMLGNEDVVNISGSVCAALNGVKSINWRSTTSFDTGTNCSATAPGASVVADIYAPAATRWHKTYWAGTTPGAVKIDFNFKYLISSKALPNFDCPSTICGVNGTIVTSGPSASDVTAAINAFATAPNGLTNNGTSKGEPWGATQYSYFFGQTGGRPEIGLAEKWWAQWLYTMDPTLWADNLLASDTSGYVPIHIREATTSGFTQACSSTRCFDDKQTVDAFGRPISDDARPNYTAYNSTAGNNCVAPDCITPVGTGHKCWSEWAAPCSGSGSDTTALDRWSPDLAHQSEFAWMAYLTTGSYYYLEEMQFWGAFDTNAGGPSSPGSCWIYGHCGTWGLMHEGAIQWRGYVWGIRNLGHAAWFSPDGTPEQNYFRQKLQYNIEMREGINGLTTGHYYTTTAGTVYQRANSQLGGPGTLANPLGYPMYLDPNAANGCSPCVTDSTKTWRDRPPWENNMYLVVVGHLTELGFPTDSILDFSAKHQIEMLRNASYNPYLVSSYVYPVFDATSSLACPSSIGGTCHNYFTTWANVLGGFSSSWLSTYAPANTWINGAPPNFTSATDPDFGYIAIALGGASFLPGHTSTSDTGQNAWNWMAANGNSNTAAGLYSAMNSDPKWAIVPRASQDQTCSISSTGLPGAVVGSAYSTTINTSGCTTPVTWSLISGSLPTGLSLSAGTGVISGTPTVAATYSFTPQVVDAATNTASKSLSILVTGSLPWRPVRASGFKCSGCNQ